MSTAKRDLLNYTSHWRLVERYIAPTFPWSLNLEKTRPSEMLTNNYEKPQPRKQKYEPSPLQKKKIKTHDPQNMAFRPTQYAKCNNIYL